MKLLREIIQTEKDIKYLVNTKKIEDASKFYIIFAANFFTLNMTVDAEERLANVTPEYLRGEFYDDILKATKSRANLIRLMDVGIDIDMCPDKEHEFIDVLHIISQQSSEKAQEITTFFEGYKEMVISHLTKTPNSTIIKIPGGKNE